MRSYHLVSDAGDQTFELPPGKRLVVGRGLSSDIALYDPTISRRHAELTARADGVQLKDLGSSNGTFVNGAKVMSGRIQAEDTVTFGRVMFHLKAPSAPVASALTEDLLARDKRAQSIAVSEQIGRAPVSLRR